jgi:dGTP triphosphohydrolase
MLLFVHDLLIHLEVAQNARYIARTILEELKKRWFKNLWFRRY